MGPILAALSAILGPVGEFGSQLGVMARNTIASRIIGASTGPIGRIADYAANSVAPTLAIPADAMIEMWQAGFIATGDVWKLLKVHGVPFGSANYAGTPLATQAELWERYAHMSRPVPDVGSLRKWMRQERITPQRYRQALHWQGFYRDTWPDLFVGDYENMPAAMLVSLHLMGLIPLAEFTSRMNALGIRPQDRDLTIQAAWHRPSVADSLLMRNRGIIDDATLNTYLQSSGFAEPAVQDRMKQLRFAVPSILEYVRTYGLRGVVAGYVNRWSLDAGYDAALDSKAAAVGLGSVAYNDGQQDVSWAKAEWRNHWQPMPVNVMIDAMRRARGNPNDPNTWAVPGVQPLSDDDVSAILTANMLAPGTHAYFTGLRYAPLSIRHIRIAFDTGNLPRAWLVEKFLDIGIKPADANTMADVYVKLRDDKANAPYTQHATAVWKNYLKAVVAGYRIGSITRATAIASLTAQNIDPVTADLELKVVEMDQLADVIKAVQRRAKSDLFNGRTDLAGARQRLIGAHMDPRLADLFLAAWQAEFGEGRRHLSTDKVLTMLRKGFIGADEALVRLSNLGWAQPDQVLMLAEIQGLQAQDQAKIVKAETMARSQQVAAMRRLLKENVAHRDTIVRRLRTLTPVDQLVRWLKKGLISEADMIDRMQLMGYDDDTILKRMGEAAIDKIGEPQTEIARAQRIINELRSETPVTQIQKFVKAGTWTRDQAIERMRLMAYPEDIINSYLPQ